MAVPNLPNKYEFASIYNANDFVGHLRENGWDPGDVPRSVIFTYGGFDLLCSAQPEHYTMNPMLGPGPGRFFTANSAAGNVGICCMGIGAPAVAAQLEVLIALGVREFLSLGTAGGLRRGQSIGDVIVLTGAARDEGVSYHYVAPEAKVRPDDRLSARLRDGLIGHGLAVAEGLTWTTDAPYRETAEEIEYYRNEGVVAVEMEAAAVFAVAEARGVRLASAVVLDAVIGDPPSAPAIDTALAIGRLYGVFLAAIDMLADKPQTA